MERLLATPARLEPMGHEVGKLEERWQFPSDHLPIGLTLERDLHIASWNVLDSKYMSWVTEKNSQGLSRSLIVDEHLFLDNSKLTVRDQHVVRLLLEMLDHPTHPKQIIALQECGDAFLQELRKELPPHYTLLSHEGQGMIVDANRFEILSAHSTAKVFAAEPERTVEEVVVRDKKSGEEIRLVNVHLPGDPTKPGRFEFADYLARTNNPLMKTVAMGDMNFNEWEMSDAVSRAFSGQRSQPTLYTSYCTNIAPVTFYSKAIDHFIVSSGSEVDLLTPEEVMVGLQPTADLLN